MGVILEIKAGAMAAKKVTIVTGQTLTFGRAAGRAQFALPHDTFMSGVHFAVECGSSGCRVQDLKSSNGTFLNGARIQYAMLANGDEIKSGQTIFSVKIVADAKLASLMAAQEVAPPSTSPQRSRASGPVVPDRRPVAGEPVVPEQRPRASEPASPVAESASPAALPEVPSAGRSAEEQKPSPGKASPQPEARRRRLTGEPNAAPAEPAADVEPPAAASAPSEEPLSWRSPVAEAEDFSHAMQSADVGNESGEPPSAKDAGAEPPARKPSGLPDAPARGIPPKPESPAKSVMPPVEEPPHFRAIPRSPVAAGNPPKDRAKPQRDVEQPISAAPPVAQKPVAPKNVERPASRGAASSLGPAFSVMGWSFPVAPAEWQVQEGFGLQQSGHEEFPSSVAATEELLGGITLQQFVESQISMLRGYLRDPKIEPTMPPRVGGADESMAMDVRHSTKDGRELVYRRIYARSGSSVGVLTVTTLAADFPQVLQTLQPLLDGAAFRSTTNN